MIKLEMKEGRAEGGREGETWLGRERDKEKRQEGKEACAIKYAYVQG